MSRTSIQQSGCAIDTRHTSSHQRPSSTSPTNKDGWKKTFSFLKADPIGRGASGTVFAINHTWAIKVFGRDIEAQSHLARENEIFDKLQSQAPSEYIIYCKEQWASGLVLERLDTTLRNLLRKFGKLDSESHHPSALRWSLECARGFTFLHDNGVIQGDIGCQNVMVSASGHAKLCDFAGSKIDQKDAWVAYEIRSQHPRYIGQQPTITTELFAIGSLLFEIWTATPPYADMPDSLVKEKFLACEFPIDCIKYPRMKEVIRKCWSGEYNTAHDVCDSIQLIQHSL
jgi:serine/threonine protein kinase